ncbi:MAG: hypothetical protein GC151_06050 [Betaproteobacteria bacterium]|nr:hypothetical protein [Betaproteobacteria bacterium]
MTATAQACVITKVVGGLGNQLFCYAAGRAVSCRTGAGLVLDLDFFRSDVRYERQYRLDCLPLGPHDVLTTKRLLPRSLDLRWWRLRRILLERGLVPGTTAIVEKDAKTFHDELLTCSVSGKLVLDGYWQDERYFQSAGDRVRAELVPRAPESERNRSLGETMSRCGSVAIHCRRHHHRLADGTVQPARGRAGLDVQYYRRAIGRLADATPIDHIFLFGDEPEWLLQALPSTIPHTVVDWNSAPGGEVDDLWLMTRSRHFVVSNSTLSWWGAWLASGHDKRVIAPRPQDLEYWVPSARTWEEIDW